MPRQQLLSDAVAIVMRQHMDRTADTQLRQQCLLQVGLFDQAGARAAWPNSRTRACHRQSAGNAPPAAARPCASPSWRWESHGSTAAAHLRRPSSSECACRRTRIRERSRATCPVSCLRCSYAVARVTTASAPRHARALPGEGSNRPKTGRQTNTGLPLDRGFVEMERIQRKGDGHEGFFLLFWRRNSLAVRNGMQTRAAGQLSGPASQPRAQARHRLHRHLASAMPNPAETGRLKGRM